MGSDPQPDEGTQEQEGQEQRTGEGVSVERPQGASDEPGVTQGETIQGDQGEQVPADATGSDPNRPVAQSAPPPGAQSGVPDLPDNANEGVEAQPEYAGPVAPGQGDTAAEGGSTTGAPADEE